MQKKKITLSTIALWVLFAVTLVLFVVFFAGPQAEYALSTQGTTETSAILDPYLYWVYVVVGLGILLLIVFAIKSVLLGFQRDAKGTIQGLITIAAFVILFVVCYFASPATEYNKIVNGENVHYDASEMKMIDMWLYSIYALVAVTFLLVIGFGVKNLIKK